jgi:hypothetical protein
METLLMGAGLEDRLWRLGWQPQGNAEGLPRKPNLPPMQSLPPLRLISLVTIRVVHHRTHSFWLDAPVYVSCGLRRLAQSQL